MLKALTLSFMVSFPYWICFAQAPDTLWTRTFGGSGQDVGESVQQTSDGGYIITGYTDSYGSGLWDVWLIKTNELGDTLWTRTFGGTNMDWAKSVEETTDGGFIVTGSTYYSTMVIYDLLLLKVNALGNIVWSKAIGGVAQDMGYSVQQTRDDGYIIIGDTWSFGAGGIDAWLLKTDSSGDTIWTKTYGGVSLDVGYSGKQTKDGGYIFTGRTNANPDSGGTWLLKTDALGKPIWTKFYGGNYPNSGNSVQQTSDGGYVITGYKYFLDAGIGDVWLIKTDVHGDTVWTKTFGGEYADEGYSVIQTTDGGYVIAGNTGLYSPEGSDVWLIRTDANGDTIWTRKYGGPGDEVGTSVRVTMDGGYILTGYTKSFGAGNEDIWLIKTAPDPMRITKNETSSISSYQLHQNYPNPFNPRTTFTFDLPRTCEVTLQVFNILGEEIAAPVSGRLSAGSHAFKWDASNLSSGIYLYRLQASDWVEIKKMIFIR